RGGRAPPCARWRQEWSVRPGRPARRAPSLRHPRAGMVVGVLRLELLLPENHSLKGKRSVLRAIKARVQNKFNVSIAECEDHDLWQRATLGVSQVGAEQGHVDACLRQGGRFIDDLQLPELGGERVEVLHYSEAPT